MARLNSLKIPTEPASTPTPNNNIEDRFEQLTGRKPYTSTSDGAISNFTQKPAPEETPDDILKRVNLELSLEQQTRQLQQEADQALKDRLERMKHEVRPLIAAAPKPSTTHATDSSSKSDATGNKADKKEGENVKPGELGSPPKEFIVATERRDSTTSMRSDHSSHSSADSLGGGMCEVCTNSATVKCKGCDGDIYCKSCFTQCHQSAEYRKHKFRHINKH